MKKSFVIVVLSSCMLFSCNSGKNDSTQNEMDSTVVVENLEAKEVEDMSKFINEVSLCLDSIQVQENLIFANKEGDNDRTRVLKQISNFKELLSRKQNQIKALTEQNKSISNNAKTTIANLQKMVDYLNAQLEEKINKIAQMEELLQNKDVKINELRYNLNELSAESEYLKDQNYEQDKEMNSRYYIVASKNELKEKGLLKGRFLKKSKVDNAGIDKSLFKRVDKRNFKTLVIQSKNPTIMTGNAQGSYTLIKNDDGTSTLTITDPEKFWNASNFLIIQL